MVWRSCAQTALLISRAILTSVSAKPSFVWLGWGYWIIQKTQYWGSVFIYYLATWKTLCNLKILWAAIFILVFRIVIKALNDMTHYTNPCRSPVDAPYSKLISCWHSYFWDLLVNHFLIHLTSVRLRLCSAHGWRRMAAQSIDLTKTYITHISRKILL